MKKINLLFTITLVVIFFVLVQSCHKNTDSGDEDTTDESFEPNTRDTTFANAVVIKYSGTSATVTNPFDSSGVSVTITNGNVVVKATTTTTEVNYVLSGIVTEGSFKIYSEYKFGLILNGVGITNDDGPAINIQSGKKVSVNVLNGTSNRLIDGAVYSTSTEDQKAAFFSEGQLVFNGNGTLKVTGNYKHGICSDDYIYFTNGNITVKSAVSDGIHANDYLKIDAGILEVNASGEGMECEEGYVQINGGTINVTTTGEKGNAIKSESYTTVNSTGIITLKVSGKAAKGFKTGGDFTLTNGNITIATSGNAFYDTDDADIAAAAGLNCDGNFKMDGGTIAITSSGTGGKGITADGTLAINAGTINITATGATFTYGSSDSEAKGIKSDGAMEINGGTITISATDDGLKSESSITINNGTVNITKSTEGVEAPSIVFNNGNVSIASSDDCINGTIGNGSEANDGSLITFAGGSVKLNTSGGDGIDGNGNVVMTGGTVIVEGPPSSPEVAIDVNGAFNISGGLLIASGPNSGNMIEATSSSSAQYTVLVKITGNVVAGTLFNIQDASGNSLVTYAPARSAYYFVYSSSSLQSGATYKVYTGGTHSGVSDGGIYSGGSYSGGTLKGSITISGKLTTVTL
jgi:trimeric autotransporter adhesin